MLNGSLWRGLKRVWSYWLTHGEYLSIRKRGRKVKELSEKEKEIISLTFRTFKALRIIF